MACPGRYREIVTSARALAASAYAPEHELRAALAELVAILAQRKIFADRIASDPPVRGSFCPVCGTQMLRSRYGRPRRTCSDRCRSALYRQAHREQIRAADAARRAATPPPPSPRAPAPPQAPGTAPAPSPANGRTELPGQSSVDRLTHQNKLLGLGFG